MGLKELLEGQHMVISDDNCVHPLLVEEGALCEEMRRVPKDGPAYAEVCLGGVCWPEPPRI